MRANSKSVIAACAIVCVGFPLTACGSPQPSTKETAAPAVAPVPTVKTEPTPEPAFVEIVIPTPAVTGAGATGRMTEFTLPSPTSAPAGMTAGADGNLWIAATGLNAIVKVTLDGAVSTFPLKAGTYPSAVVAGPDGNVWFAQRGGVGRITPSGDVTTFAVNGIPAGIAPGPDGHLWFTENFRGAIGRVTMSGAVTLFPIPTRPGGGSSNPLGIAAGPDGNLWFTESNPNARKVGRITPAGVITEFDVPGEGSPQGIAAGPDGNVWFTEDNGAKPAKVASITPPGVITEYVLPGDRPQPATIVAGPDGNLWVTQTNDTATSVARVTPSGLSTSFPVPTKFSGPYGLTVGADGNLWFTERGKGKFGRVHAATEGTRYVLHLASGFVPSSTTVAQGQAVEWINQVPGRSSVRQASPAPVFDSSPKGTGSTYVIRFPVAGTYAYGDNVHTSYMGTVTVPMQVAPDRGTETTSFTITWATGTAPVVPGGWVIDVQVAVPSASDFVVWQESVTTTSASYTPTAGKGTYRFRTRLRHQAAKGGADWSPVASITVQ